MARVVRHEVAHRRGGPGVGARVSCAAGAV